MNTRQKNVVVLAVMAAILFCSTVKAQLPAVESADVLLDLKFDKAIPQGVTNIMEGGYPCALMGGVSWTSSGHEGGAMEFNGTNSYITIPGPIFCQNDAESFMLEAWIKTESNAFRSSIMTGDGYWKTCVSLQIDSTGVVRFPTLIIFEEDDDVLLGKTRVNDGHWHHVAVVFERGVGKKIYVDGQLDSSNKTARVGGDTEMWRIGKCAPMWPHYYKGLIDDVRISVLGPAGDPAPGGKIILGSEFENILLGSRVEARAVGVLPDCSPQEKKACRELINYLAQMTGKRLPKVTVTNNIVEPGIIAVGRLAVKAGIIRQEELDNVQRDGYVVKVQRGRAGVCGWRDIGTVYGVYALLQKAGVRFYARDCEIVPRQKTLRLGKYEIHKKPLYEFRRMNVNLKLGQTPDSDLALPSIIGEPGKGFVHTAGFLVPYERYHKEHPEYFALQKDGRRISREYHLEPILQELHIHLCLSNPDVRRIATERLLYLMERQKDRIYFGVSAGDNLDWCQCEQCRAYDPDPTADMNKNEGHRSLSDRNLNFVNELARAAARQYPDKRILMLAYCDTARPPVKTVPEPNVRVMYCGGSCQSHGLDCERNREDFENLKGWLAKCPQNMYTFDYPRNSRGTYTTSGSFYAMKWKLDYYVANGTSGIVFCGVPTDFADLFEFVFSRLLWEPRADFEGLIDEFMKAYYGPAAGPMRKYFNYLYEEIAKRPVHLGIHDSGKGVVTPEYAARAYEWFAEAELAAGNDETLVRRVQREKLCVLLTDLNEYNPVKNNLWGSPDDFAGRLAEFMRITSKKGTVGFYIGTQGLWATTSDWLYRVARIRLQAKPWYADPLIKRFLADPADVLAEERQKYLKDCQKEIQGGWLLDLDIFHGGARSEKYSHQCEPRRSIWIKGKNTDQPSMWTALNLDKLPAGKPFLALDGLDDDKPGVVRVLITVNGKEIFAGPNPFKENGWTTHEFPIPDGVLQAGENKIVFSSMDDSRGSYQGWFMISECRIVFK